MKKILVAVDFSEASRRAMDYTAALAKSFDVNIVLVYALLVPAPIGDAPGYIPVSLPELQAEYEALLQREIEYMTEKHAAKTDGYVRLGAASGVIKDLAAEIDADLVVVGMKGAGKTGGIFGSTATASIRKSKKPLLVIPENALFKPIKNICFAADFENLPPQNHMGILKEIALKYAADLQILHVQKVDAMMHAGEIWTKMGTDVFFDGIKHSFDTIEDEDIEKGISDFLGKRPADLLVMVTHHHNLLERLFGKSHTKQMAYQTSLPLLVLHD